MTRIAHWPLADIRPARPGPRPAADLQRPGSEWFHIERPRNEVVGEQPPGEDADTRSTADVYVYDRIGGWGGVTAEDFVRDVAGLDVDHINLHLNSPGGDAFEGVAIANVLRAHRADVTVWVDGIAASACSVIAMAGDEVIMGVGSAMMIHDASAYAWGDADTMRKAAAMLDGTSNAIAGTYAAKAGGTAAEWRAVMVAEAWYTGEEAVTAGLADRVATDDDKGTASGEQIVPGSSSFDYWDLWDSLSDAERHTDTLRELYAHASRAEAPAPPMPGRGPGSPSPAASAGGSNPEEGALMPDLPEGLRQRLGIADDADEATALAAIDALEKRAEKPAELPENIVTVDKEALASLQADAAAGREAREQQMADRRERLVTDAVTTGRISASKKSREDWLRALATDPNAEANLAALAPGLIPVNGEIGHAGGGPDAATDESDDALDQLAAQAGLQKGALHA
ncbi:head maturation protease, ClpP-related [Blastococcus sp. CT_GayMR16]|uniref:head maturation protease, ClpP-related n=1 Tax=Blastococcus sp. CT_GayMR16 TaxID=2559607 RepID=UPI0010749729|nr:head maturation protease, ClpP-related [Blastococcus sp. CT_GayMR16]TFV83151.1 hypothetical protein E4P38_21075 [Blastococcus sp. CT_GayMR16]